MSPTASSIWGPILIGVILNVVLYGITIMQTALYFSVFKKDKLTLKCVVSILFVCDTLNSAFDVALVYIPFIVHWGELHAIEYANWLSGADSAMTAIIASIVQVFFAWRLKILTGSWTLVVAICLCSFLQWSGGMGTAIAIKSVPQFEQFQRFQVVVIIWLAFAALADAIITVSLVWYLRKHRTGFSETDDTINRIVRLTVSTGMITAVCAIIHLICFVASPSGAYLVFNLPLSKLYTNSLMSSLNSRTGWAYGHDPAGATGHCPESCPVRFARPADTQQTTDTTQIAIEMEDSEILQLELDRKSTTSTAVPV